MPSGNDYLLFVLENLSSLDGVSYRPMMGEYLIYYKGKLVGGIYDDRFLLKPTASAVALLKDASYEVPYAGAKPMLLVDELDGGLLAADLVEAVFADLK